MFNTLCAHFYVHYNILKAELKKGRYNCISILKYMLKDLIFICSRCQYLIWAKPNTIIVGLLFYIQQVGAYRSMHQACTNMRSF